MRAVNVVPCQWFARQCAAGLAVLMAAALSAPSGAIADPVDVVITADAPDAAAGRPVSWSATPMDLPADADVLGAMVMTPEPVVGAWSVALEPGRYLISGFTEAELYETEVTVPAPEEGASAPPAQAIVVPVLPIKDPVAFRCTDAPGCDFADPQTGLALRLPMGWAIDTPYHADLGGGEVAPEISTVIYQDVEGDGAAVWFLNPADWIVEDNGPCRAVSIGVLCTFEISDAAEQGFAVIAPSLGAGPAAAGTTP